MLSLCYGPLTSAQWLIVKGPQLTLLQLQVLKKQLGDTCTILRQGGNPA